MENLEKVRQIALNIIEGLNNQSVDKLIEYCDGTEEIFNLNQLEIENILNVSANKAEKITSQFHDALEKAKKEYEFCLRNSITPLFYKDEGYPFRLLECYDFPIMLYVKGNIDFNSKRYVSVVGTRQATEHGRKVCRKFVEDLAGMFSDTVIVSGLAYGIDVTSQRAALDSNLHTIGIIGGGYSWFYPKDHIPTAKKIIETGGAIITEYESDVKSFGPNFVKRNRIIAGMSDATVVVESTISGGSMITARIADSYNRDIFAFPGRVGERLSEGCNNLIKYERAALIENADDFAYFMGWSAKGKPNNIAAEYKDMTNDERSVYFLLEKEKTLHHDNLALKLPDIDDLELLLLNMEMKRIISQLPGNFYSLC